MVVIGGDIGSEMVVMIMTKLTDSNGRTGDRYRCVLVSSFIDIGGSSI